MGLWVSFGILLAALFLRNDK